MDTRSTTPLRPGEQHIIAALRRCDGASRRALAELTGLPRTTVTATVATLIERGLLTEDARPVSTGPGAGRPAATVRFAVADKTVVAFELGRTHQSAALLGFDGRILSTAELHLDPTERFAEASKRFATAIEQLTTGGNQPSYAVLSVAMPFRHGHGAAPIPLHSASDGPRPEHRFRRPEWLLADPTEALSDVLGMPVMIENDANLAALGEAGHGAARDAQAAVHINVVTGFGAGLIIGGRLFRGAGGVAGELAHVSIKEGGDICVCGNRGCVITVRRNGPSMVDEIAIALGHVPTMNEIITLAGDGDLAVVRWLTDLGRLLAQPLAGFVTLLNPDLLVVDGALGPGAEPVVNGIRETIEHRTPPMTHRSLQVRPGHLAAPIPVGAAVLAHQTYLDTLLTAPHALLPAAL